MRSGLPRRLRSQRRGRADPPEPRVARYRLRAGGSRENPDDPLPKVVLAGEHYNIDSRD
jgi:hypothetical protein